MENGNVRFTMVSFKPSSNQRCGKYYRLTSLKNAQDTFVYVETTT